MTRESFLGTIDWNLQQLARYQAPMPTVYMPERANGLINGITGARKIKRVLSLSKGAIPAPNNIAVWDIVGGKSPYGRPLRWRIFACWCEAATAEAYQQVKRQLRKWYEPSGLGDGIDVPYSGAIVFGAAEAWPAGINPDGGELPKCVATESLVSAGKIGHEMRTIGSKSLAASLRLAIAAEPFELCRKRVVETLERLAHTPDSGWLTAELVAEEAAVSARDAVNIFKELEIEGKLRIGRREAPVEARRIFADFKSPAPSWLRKFFSNLRSRKPWFVQDDDSDLT